MTSDHREVQSETTTECPCQSIYEQLPESTMCHRMSGRWVAYIPSGGVVYFFSDTRIGALRKLLENIKESKHNVTHS